MSAAAIGQIVALGILLVAVAPPLGAYLARIYDQGPDAPAAPGERFFARLEQPVYRLLSHRPARRAELGRLRRPLIAFSAVSVLALYALLRLPGQAAPEPDRPARCARPDCVQHCDQLHDEHQLAGLQRRADDEPPDADGRSHRVQNFASAAAGIAVLAAVIRGLVRRRSGTVGDFWVDLVRTNVRVLLPLSALAALVLIALGVIQNLDGLLPSAGGLIPGGPVASQIAIKQLGSNGGGFFNANSAHPFENPDALSNLFENFLILILPFALVLAFGRMAGDRRQGWALGAVMVALWLLPTVLGSFAESGGNSALDPAGVDQANTPALAGGGNLEGKELRFGTDASALWAGSTTGTSNGSVNSAHDSFTPLGGLVPLGEMMLGEVSPGGVGVGLMGMLVYAILAVFIVGLMVGRTPEYLGKKIGPAQMKLVSLYLLAMPITVLTLAAISVAVPSLTDSIAAPGPHGLSEVLYAFASGANNNGSAFGGIGSADDWYAISIGGAMMIGRFALIVPALAIAGTLGRETVAARTVATLPTGSPMFAGVLLGVVLVVSGLVFFPALALGPISEALSDRGGRPVSAAPVAPRAARRPPGSPMPRPFAHAIVDSFRKLDPRRMASNPVMFVVEVGTVLSMPVHDRRGGRCRAGRRSATWSRSGSG